MTSATFLWRSWRRQPEETPPLMGDEALDNYNEGNVVLPFPRLGGPPGGPPLNPPGGGGTFNMEARVAKLEATTDYIKNDVGMLKTDMRDVRDRVARIEEMIKNLPSKGFIITVVSSFLAICIALLSIVPRLQSWVGVLP